MMPKIQGHIFYWFFYFLGLFILETDSQARVYSMIYCERNCTTDFTPKNYRYSMCVETQQSGICSILQSEMRKHNSPRSKDMGLFGLVLFSSIVFGMVICIKSLVQDRRERFNSASSSNNSTPAGIAAILQGNISPDLDDSTFIPVENELSVSSLEHLPSHYYDEIEEISSGSDETVVGTYPDLPPTYEEAIKCSRPVDMSS